MAWTILDKTLVYDGWGRFLLLDVEVANGVVVKRQLDDHGLAACVLAYDPGRRTALLASQPRVGPLFMGLEPRLAEAAAGMFDAEESGIVSFCGCKGSGKAPRCDGSHKNLL